MFSVAVVKMGSSDKLYYNVNDAPISIDSLRNLLKQTAENDPDTTVIIKCGPNAKHSKLITLLDACAEAGLSKLNLVELNIAFEGK